MFKFFMDPGHGWLKVKKTDLEKYGVANKISHFSYEKGDYAYLEEDVDAGIFLDAWKKAHNNKEPKIDVKISSRASKIRGYRKYSK